MALAGKRHWARLVAHFGRHDNQQGDRHDDRLADRQPTGERLSRTIRGVIRALTLEGRNESAKPRTWNW